jgi:L-aminopeptidase/D-esterase-like protein
MITDVAGVRVGHWTDPVGRTGCTVVLFPDGTVASGEIRGGAPGTREWALLDPSRTVARIDAVVLTGGSAFGLAACDGAARWCEERGMGFPTAAGPVPIVVGAVLYDLAVGDSTARPRADDGYEACAAATSGRVAVGPVGAGCGATVGKWRGPDHVRPGGIGAATVRFGEVVVAAMVAVNAWGDVRAEGDPLDLGGAAAGMGAVVDAAAVTLSNTSVGVIVTNAALDKSACLLVAQSGHDGLGRALEPVHSTADGDALVAAATGGVQAPIEVVRLLAARAVEAAVRSGVPPTTTPSPAAD